MHRMRTIAFFVCILVAGLWTSASADIKVSPHYLFVSSASSHLISLNVSNDGNDEREVWIDTRYGYETSDDTGRIFIRIDTAAVDEPSAATWIKCYPKRFILKGGESQTVRFMVTAPAGVQIGEYWSRVIIASKPRQIPKGPAASTTVKPGISILMEQSIPFHYRVGTVNTGVRFDTLSTQLTDTGLVVTTKLLRTGSAAFWGSRTIQLNDRGGKNWLNWTHNTGVYKDLLLVDRFNRTSFPPGEYVLSVRLHSDGRTDIPPKDLLRIAPVEISIPVTIP
jgi:P pilus assembly chaperone PapD